MLLFLPAWPRQKEKANASTKNNFDIQSAAESSKVDSQDQNINSVNHTEERAEAKGEAVALRKDALNHICWQRKFVFMQHFINLKLVRL